MTCSRREFIIAGTSVIAATSIGTVYSLEINGNRFGLLHDEQKCIGCTACMEACRTTNKVPDGVSRLEIIRTDNGAEYPDKEFSFFRQSCQHCDDPPCVDVCPSGASFKDTATGIVDVDADLCVGCQYCVAACPYQVRFINPETLSADKCDFCRKTNLAEGKLPACVLACPTQALVFGDLDDPDSEINRLISDNYTYRSKVKLGTRPKLFHLAKSGGVS